MIHKSIYSNKNVTIIPTLANIFPYLQALNNLQQTYHATPHNTITHAHTPR